MTLKGKLKYCVGPKEQTFISPEVNSPLNVKRFLIGLKTKFDKKRGIPSVVSSDELL